MIGIEHAKQVDPEIIVSLKRFFVHHGHETRVHVREDRMLNSLEWALPALVTLWISKTFFDGFLKEMGKDSAVALKSLLRDSYSKIRGTINRAYDADELRKLADGAAPDSVGRRGPALKIVVDVLSSDGSSSTSLSCIIPDGLTDIEIEIASSALVDNMHAALDHNSKLLDDPSHARHSYAVIYDRDDGWVAEEQLIMKQASDQANLAPMRPERRSC